MDATLWQAVIGIVGIVGAFLLWLMRLVIREEFQRALREFKKDEFTPLQQDVEVLHIATFNHLSHGEIPKESDIRRSLGFPERRQRYIHGDSD